ncbi:hypothetical protein NP233_g7372 [Leucocoprinus birnbaumii]|uniref:Uncharacterized protein n=1 Tax=Leucocoprinus birnbaumii TaxID=56174 RepID=A0AAD5VPH6_9AGAR|nr:hypothetical protein NP233_g7372 [Leucocoprinus birnbaumii]
MTHSGSSIVKTIVISALLFQANTGVCGSTITLYGLSPTSTPSAIGQHQQVSWGITDSISPVSTREDGKTVYQDVNVITQIVYSELRSVSTRTSDLPQTTTRALHFTPAEFSHI